MAEPVTWHIDGRVVHLDDDWEATVVANGGYDQLTASAPRKELLRAHQGSHISGQAEDGTEVWYGEIDATPAESRLDVVKLTATGPAVKARRMRDNWLEQSRDYEMFKPQDSDPYTYGGASTISPDQQGGRLAFSVSNGTDIKSSDTHGFVAWFPNEPVTRIAFDWASNVASTDHVLQVWTGNGPNGTLTQQGADISLNATSGSVDRDVTTEGDLAVIRIKWTSANTTTTSAYRVRVTALRVNGRTGEDDLAPGDILADMGAALGMDISRVQSSGINGLPFYWAGGSWADAFDELAGLDDWSWQVDRQGLIYGEWEDAWDLRFSKENEDLDFLPLSNVVRVFYTTRAGSPRSVSLQADPDPLARWGLEREYEYDLNDSYPDDTTPTAVAAALLELVSRQQVVGTVTITQADRRTVRHASRTGWTNFSGHSRYLVRPGQRTRLVPYPDLPAQRIQQVRMRRDAVEVSLGLDVEEVSALKVLARQGHYRGKRRKP